MDNADIKDKNGKILRQFLQDYDPSLYRHPAVTADIIVTSGGKLLLIKRGGHPFINCWAFPGGFLEYGESAEQCASRELFEETSIAVPLRQYCTISTSGRDPRDWTITVCFRAEADEKVISGARAADDAAELCWFEYNVATESENNYLITLKCGEKELRAELRAELDVFGKLDLNSTKILFCDGIAFDHAKIMLKFMQNL